jgi:hypothetical protein
VRRPFLSASICSARSSTGVRRHRLQALSGPRRTLARRASATILFLLVCVIALAEARALTGGHARGRPASHHHSAPPSAPHALSQSWDGFGVGNWPGAGWRPYSADSPFNEPVVGSRVYSGSKAIVDFVISHFGRPSPLVAGTSQSGDDYGHPVYYSQRTDPEVTLRGNSRNSLNGQKIPVPIQAQPADGGDHHMTIVTPNGWEYDLWEARRSGSKIYFATGGRERIDGTGVGHGATASEFAGLAGEIRPEELAAGHIDHALFIVLGCTSDSLRFGDGERQDASPGDSGSFVYPATQGGARCGPQALEAPPMGTRFWLDMSHQQIQALRVPGWKKTILTALAVYGGFVGDTGGPGFGFQFQSSATYTSFGYPDPLVALARSYHLRGYEGQYAFNLANGVNWRRYLRVIVPPKRAR